MCMVLDSLGPQSWEHLFHRSSPNPLLYSQTSKPRGAGQENSSMRQLLCKEDTRYELNHHSDTFFKDAAISYYVAFSSRVRWKELD